MTPTKRAPTAKILRNLQTSLHLSLFKITLVIGIALIASIEGFAQDTRSGLWIVEPNQQEGTTLVAPGSVEIIFTAESTDVRKVRVKVDSAYDAKSQTISIDPNQREHVVTVKLFKGVNYIDLIGFRRDEPDDSLRARLRVTCTGRKCGAEDIDSTSAADENTERPKPKGKKPTKKDATETAEEEETGDEEDQADEENEKLVSITLPSDKAEFENETLIASNIVVKKESKVTKLLIQVANHDEQKEEEKDTQIPQGGLIDVGTIEGEEKVIKRKIRIGRGTNIITVFDALKPTNEQTVSSITITCLGDKCGTEADIANISTNTSNTRVVVGLEQAGASAAQSETKPFLDLFFTGPLKKNGKHDALPRLSTWGQIRLSTTPEQTGAAGAFPSNLVNRVTQSNETIDLVHSFDFMAGLEFRVLQSEGYFSSLIPGIKQKTGIYLVGGGGAISPLSTTKESAEIFSVPEAENPQFELFKSRFGAEAAKKKYVAFVLPERDRFLRQYYGGLRFKTYYFNKDEEPINRFPAILDVMFGQNEAVTGGKFKNDVTDETGKILGQKRSWVFRLDGFYPLPFREASFLYLYGTAMMKFGGGGVRITTPLFLDTAPGDVLVTNNNVFIAPNLQLNRDYYKIGVGINLTDLFNRKTNH